MKGTVTDLLDIAKKQIGVRENPPESNTVRYNTWYYGREVSGKSYPWCMVFVQWVFDQAGVKLPRRTASCGDLMNGAKTKGQWVTKDFRPGDVVIYDFPGGANTDHCGIVERVAGGQVVAIEGNTGAGSDADGGQVQRRTRPLRQVVGAVRCEFNNEEEDEMTGKEIYDALNDYLSKQPVPAWAKDEIQQAVAAGITDGKNMTQLVPRYQAAIMALRAVKTAQKQ